MSPRTSTAAYPAPTRRSEVASCRQFSPLPWPLLKDELPGSHAMSPAAAIFVPVTGGLSSSTIVPTPTPSAIVAPLGSESTTWNVSSSSSAVSPATCTVTVRLLVRRSNDSEPEVAAKSLGSRSRPVRRCEAHARRALQRTRRLNGEDECAVARVALGRRRVRDRERDPRPAGWSRARNRDCDYRRREARKGRIRGGSCLQRTTHRR